MGLFKEQGLSVTPPEEEMIVGCTRTAEGKVQSPLDITKCRIHLIAFCLLLCPGCSYTTIGIIVTLSVVALLFVIGLFAAGKTVAFFKAAQTGDAGLVEKMLSSGFDISSTDPDGKTALHIAAEYGNVTMIQLLLSKGAGIAEESKPAGNHELAGMVAGRTALNFAVDSGNAAAVKFLLDNGSDPNGQDPMHPPIVSAGCNGNTEVVNILLDNGADPNRGAAPVNITAMHHAVKHGVEFIYLLLSKGAAVDPVDWHGETPLFEAIRRRDAPVTAYLIQNGASVDRTDDQGISIRDLAARYDIKLKNEKSRRVG